MPADRPARRERPPGLMDAAPRPEAEPTALLNLRWADLFVASLVEAGVREVVIAPGSRSAPLVLAISRSLLRAHVALDERAGAFFALGLAKGSRRPAAILCTSGTAAANLYPALLEAHHGRVPILALTADRPPELRDTGAPQTTDQIKLFGDRVRWFCEVGAPGPEPELLRYVASLGARAVAAALGPPAGPVHLNFAFREPLVPQADAVELASAIGSGAADPIETDRFRFPPEAPTPPRGTVERASRLLRGRRRGLIVCGPDDPAEEFPAAVAALAAATGYPVLADPLSQLRYGRHDRARVHGSYDLFLRAPSFVEREAPEVIVQFGAAPTSKSLARYGAAHPDAVRLSVDAAGAWRDPSRSARTVVAADPARFAAALAQALAKGSEPLPAWGETFARAERAASDAATRRLREEGATITEPGLFPALLEAMPEEAALFAGNSMPIRDLDAFAPSSTKSIRVLGNRGLSGIDGLLSTALGASATLDRPLLAVVGDLSFHHDLNGLAAVREGAACATIVVVNNDGGGIFSMLPIAEHGATFERYFATPHGLEFEAACALYGLSYARPATLSELAERASASLASGRAQVLEVRTDRAWNAAIHREIAAAAIRAVEEGA